MNEFNKLIDQLSGVSETVLNCRIDEGVDIIAKQVGELKEKLLGARVNYEKTVKRLDGVLAALNETKQISWKEWDNSAGAVK